MGCDIHLHIELKIQDKWEHYAAPSIKRWYDLFGLLAGVRNTEIEPISYPKGLPDDVSTITKLERDYFGQNGHSDSWLNAKEILKLSEKLFEWAEENSISHLDYDLEHTILHTYLFGNSFAGYEDSYLPNCISDIRFVFWFDN